jgi:hypothetical protein
MALPEAPAAAPPWFPLNNQFVRPATNMKIIKTIEARANL